MSLKQEFDKKWQSISFRERLVLLVGIIFVLVLLLYQFAYRPVNLANTTMRQNISSLRSNLVWLREQAEYGGGGQNQSSKPRNEKANESLVSILESVARANNLEGSIQQLTPGEDQSRVRVVLEGASFNSWVKWISMLEQQYGVMVESATVERQETPDSADVRMEFRRD